MKNSCMPYTLLSVCTQHLFISLFINLILLQFPSELDPWKMLQTHILEDYMGHEVSEFSSFCLLVRYWPSFA